MNVEMNVEASVENPHAGQGAVIVDIGGDIGALVVLVPDDMIGLEVEIVPTGTADPHRLEQGHGHDDDHGHGQGHGHGHGHGHEHGELPPHVEVHPRPLPDGSVVASLVYGELEAGVYDLYVRPDGPVRVTAEVVGGEVTEARWPSGA